MNKVTAGLIVVTSLFRIRARIPICASSKRATSSFRKAANAGKEPARRHP
jgi:hypothetical protein